MSGVTSDSNDPRLTHGSDEHEVPQAEVYLVLSAEVLAKGFVRPVRRSYIHSRPQGCGTVTTMGPLIAETYARDPHFYGATYCCGCNKHRPVGEDGEFVWINPDGTLSDQKVGT